MKIRTYLALMAGAVLVPVVLFSAFALDLLLKAEREAVLRSMHELARATVFAVEGEFSRSEGVVRALATSNALQTGDFATFYRQAVATNAGRGSNVSLVDENGDRLLTTVVPYGTPLPKLPEANRARAVSAFANAKPQISDLIYGPITGQYLAAVELVVPVADGRRYLISEWKYTSFFKALLPTRNVPKSWLIGVFDRAGVTVVRNAGPDEFIGKPPKDDLLAAIRSEGVDQIRNQSREGVELYTALARSPKAGWTVAVGVPVAEIEAAATRAVLVAGAGLLGAIVCALAAALLFGFRLTRSLD